MGGTIRMRQQMARSHLCHKNRHGLLQKTQLLSENNGQKIKSEQINSSIQCLTELIVLTEVDGKW